MPLGAQIGLSKVERERWSFGDLILSGGSGSSFYQECSDEVARKVGRAPAPGYLFVPRDVLQRHERTLTVSSSPKGGYLVSTENDVDFASALRARSVVANLPLRRLPGLVGHVTIPRGKANATTSWLGSETSQAPEGDPTFGQGSLTGKTISTVVDISRSLMQGMGERARGFIDAELAGAVGQSTDIEFLAGSGAAGRPLGVIRTPGVVDVSGASLAWSNICAMLKAVETYGDQSSVRWVVGVTAAELLRQRERAAGSGFILDDDRIASRGALVTSAMPADALVCAAWDNVAMGEWGALEFAVTGARSTEHFRAGIVSVRLMWTIDFCARQPSAVSKSESIT